MYYKYAKGIANAFKYTKGGLTPDIPGVNDGDGSDDKEGFPLMPVGTFIVGAIVGVIVALAVASRRGRNLYKEESLGE